MLFGLRKKNYLKVFSFVGFFSSSYITVCFFQWNPIEGFRVLGYLQYTVNSHKDSVGESILHASLSAAYSRQHVLRVPMKGFLPVYSSMIPIGRSWFLTCIFPFSSYCSFSHEMKLKKLGTLTHCSHRHCSVYEFLVKMVHLNIQDEEQKHMLMIWLGTSELHSVFLILSSESQPHYVTGVSSGLETSPKL